MDYQKMTKKALIEMMQIKDETIDCLSTRCEQLGRAYVEAQRHHAQFLITMAKSVMPYNAVEEAERILRNENYKN